MYATTDEKKFLLEHAEKGKDGWVCKDTEVPIQHVAVRQVSGSPVFEPGDRGIYPVTVAYVWCPACGGKEPDTAKLRDAHVSEANLVPLF